MAARAGERSGNGRAREGAGSVRVVRAHTGRVLAYPGARLEVLLAPGPAGPAAALLGTVELMPGACLPEPPGLSSHPVEELAYVLSGRLQLWVEGEEVELGPGDAVFLRPGERHRARNPGSAPCRALFVLAPPVELP